jgi:hypothetical protein
VHFKRTKNTHNHGKYYESHCLDGWAAAKRLREDYLSLMPLTSEGRSLPLKATGMSGGKWSQNGLAAFISRLILSFALPRLACLDLLLEATKLCHKEDKNIFDAL